MICQAFFWFGSSGPFAHPVAPPAHENHLVLQDIRASVLQPDGRDWIAACAR